MELILWRHAEAEDIHDGITDDERELTAKGKRQAKKMAGWLSPRLLQDVSILVSPARRCIQTAEALQCKFEISDHVSTAASLADHLGAVRWPVGGNVLLVGHQPTLGQLAALLMSGHPSSWDIKKGAVWWLRSTPEGDVSHATLRVAMSPGMLE